MSTYTPIATQTLSANTASVTFSSIPQGYTDLVLVSRMGNSNAATGFGSGLTLNNDAVAIGKLSYTILYGNGSAAGSFRWTTSTSGNVTVPLGIEATTLNAGGMSVMQLMNYSNSTTFKTILTRGGAAGSDTLTYVSLWQDTSPINKITIYPNDATNTILSGSTFSLYGIQVGNSSQKAQGGNIVTTDGTYVYHTFTSSGAFTPAQNLTVDYLVVAGGGGGGGWQGGGGGAGGLRSTVTATGRGGSLESALSVSSGNSYPVIIGAGGAGNSYISGATPDNVTSGSNSVFATITSTGGGRGGSYSSNVLAAANGGSGGGGTDPGSGSGAGSGTANQGYDGGAYYTGNPYNAGGGGGAGAAGGNASFSNGGAGGNGVAVAISGSSITYAGGGGGGTAGNSTASRTGGTGGTGGGGAGGNSTGIGNNSGGTGSAGGNGTANLGAGGGGAGYGSNSGSTFGGAGGNGGSGVVIIRYAI